MKSLIALCRCNQITLIWVSLSLAVVAPATISISATRQQADRSAAREGRSGDSSTGLLDLDTSDASLAAGFGWARRQGLAYAFSGDPVGEWYEAALPGRQAFCMRDVAHQSMGAHFLGLAHHTHNMFRRFAENVSDSRDWCSYWEIDRDNRPAPVDYK